MGSEEVTGLELVPRPVVHTAAPFSQPLPVRKTRLSPAPREATALGRPLAYLESNGTAYELEGSIGWLP